MLAGIPKVVIVDDHEFYRNGLTSALKRIKFVDLLFEAIDGQDFLQKQMLNPGDIAFIDIQLPGMGGYEAVIESKKLFPELKIIVLTMFADDELIKKFIDLGVDGYLLKNIDQKDLEIALKRVIEGHHYYSKELMSYFAREIKQKHHNTNKRTHLTARELEILQLIFDGLSNREIADKLYVSIRTVTNHRYNLKKKTSSKNTAGLISFGLKNGLIK